MAEVVSIHGAPVHAGDPVEPCVSALEDMLERARAGEVIGVAMAVMHSDRSSSFTFGGYLDSYGVIGALEMVRAKIVADQLERLE